MVLFVGNLNTNAIQKDLLDLFQPFGEVVSVQIIKNPINFRSRGFAYVQMDESASGLRAIASLNNKLFMEQELVVTDKGPRHPVRTSLMPPPAVKKNKKQ